MKNRLTDEERRAKHAAYMREWKKKHPHYMHEQRMEYQRRWREENPEKRAEYNARALAGFKKRYHSDPEHRAKALANAARWRSDPKNREYHKEYVREWHLLHFARKLGLSQEEFEAIRPRLDGPCEICGRIKRLVMDHDHQTGKLRGFLCRRCNTGIGILGDTREHVSKAISYLERSLDTNGAAAQ